MVIRGGKWEMLLTGTFHRAVDEKLRFAIPREIRDEMKLEEGGVLYIAPGTDGSLAVYPEPTFSDLANSLSLTSPASNQVRAFSRLFYAQARRVESDGQGRIRIPAELAKLAALRREIVLLGVRDHLELWDRESWQHYLSDKQPFYDQIAEAAFDPDSTETTTPKPQKKGKKQAK